MKKHDTEKYKIFIFSIIITIGIIFVMTKIDNKSQTKSLTSREVALSCPPNMVVSYHIHPELEIFIRGEKIAIPEDIGIKQTCMTPLHTHDDLPLIHVESPVQMDFTLGDFFAVWDEPFDSMNILDFSAEKEGQVKITVNGIPVDTFENTILRDKDKIVIEAN